MRETKKPEKQSTAVGAKQPRKAARVRDLHSMKNVNVKGGKPQMKYGLGD